MTPQERELIESVFSRLTQVAGAPKDPEAAALIADRLRTLPDGPYGLVQAVVVQEMALQQAKARITELESRQAPAPAGGFTGAANPWVQSSAPPTRGASILPSVPMGPPPGMMQQGGWAPQAPTGSGFLGTALTTAAGVAGGMLLAEGVSSLFSGHQGGGLFGGGSHAAAAPAENVVVNNYYGDAPADTYSDGADADAASGGDDSTWM